MKKNQFENTLGMFNLLRGVAMLSIVFMHSISVFSGMFSTNMTSIEQLPFSQGISILVGAFCVICFLIQTASMPALLMVSGYGMRKRTFSDGFFRWGNELVRRYIVTMIFTVLLNCSLHYLLFRYLPGAITESLKVFGGMALGLTQTTTFGNVTLFANGPVWFLLALFWALVIFNLILNKVEEKRIPYVVIATSLIGWLLSYVKYTPWCISQGLISVFYVYLGYYIKKEKLFLKDLSWKEKVLFAAFVIVPNLVSSALGKGMDMADNVYSFGPLTYVENGLFGIFFLYISLKANVFKGRICAVIRTVGRYSLYVMCVHSAEMIAVPWYLFGEKFADRPIMGFVLVYITRLIIIAVGVFVIIKIAKMTNTTKRKKKTPA